MQTALMQGIRSLPRTTLCPHILPVESSRSAEDITRPQFRLDALEYENEELRQKANDAEALAAPSSTNSYTTADSPTIDTAPAADPPVSNEKIESLTKEQDSLTKALQVGDSELFGFQMSAYAPTADCTSTVERSTGIQTLVGCSQVSGSWSLDGLFAFVDLPCFPLLSSPAFSVLPSSCFKPYGRVPFSPFWFYRPTPNSLVATESFVVWYTQAENKR